MHIPARKGEWGQTSVVNILTNEVYLGKIRWRREPVKRVVKDGFLAKTRIINDDYDLYDGRHEPIITQEQWDRVKAAQSKRGHHSTHTTKELKNPFAGILFCGKCGAALKRNATLSKEIKKLQTSEAELIRKQETGSKEKQAAMDIIPTTQQILNNYDVLTIAEKNRLWKLVLKKTTVYRTPAGELSVHIYPRLPK